MRKKSYDISSKVNDFTGFYEWNKSTFFVKKDDERYKKFIDQKKKYGFSDEETWSLYYSISLFIYPRIKRFIKIIKEKGVIPTGISENDWINILQKIAFSFEKIIKYDDEPDAWNDKTKKKVDEGLDLFREWFFDLWW